MRIATRVAAADVAWYDAIPLCVCVDFRVEWDVFHFDEKENLGVREGGRLVRDERTRPTITNSRACFLNTQFAYSPPRTPLTHRRRSVEIKKKKCRVVQPRRAASNYALR